MNSTVATHPTRTIAKALDTISAPTAAVRWLLDAGPVAKKLNLDSTRDNGCANNAPLLNK